MVADPLDRLCHPQRIERRRNRARIFHHEGDQVAHDRTEFMIDQLVLRDQTGGVLFIESGEGVERIVQHVAGATGNDPHGFILVDVGATALLDGLGGTRNLGRFVADALQIGDDLDGRHHGAQVVGRRLAPHDQVTAGIVERDFELVDVFIGLDDLLRPFGVAGPEARHRIMELAFDQAAHEQHLGADCFQIEIVLFRRMNTRHRRLLKL
jgi:hypothetical protein